MLSTPRRAAKALFKTGVLLYASSAVTNTAAHSEDPNCASFSSASTAGHPEDVSFATPTYFACADGSFLTSVEGSYDKYIRSLSWTCSDLTKMGSLTGDGDGAVSFTVGITAVQTGATSGPLGFLADMHFGGYDVDGVSLSWKGPFGAFEKYDGILPDVLSSDCGRDAFATGVTVWASSTFVYGVMLQCATVTATCYPPRYQAGSSSSFSDASSIVGATVGGGLLLVAIAVGVTCCTCRRRRGPSKTSGQSTVVGATAVANERGSVSGNENTGTARHSNTGVPPAPVSPPPRYTESPYHLQPRSPAFA